MDGNQQENKRKLTKMVKKKLCDDEETEPFRIKRWRKLELYLIHVQQEEGME
jgi:hypothetical protein